MALDISTPIPDQITGFLAFRSKVTAFLMSEAVGDWGERFGER